VTEPGDFPRSTPEAEGIPSAAIRAFVEAADREVHAIHSVMLLRHGRLLAAGWWEPYGAALPHLLYSLSKSFTSTAIGMLVAEGRLSVDDLVLDFFPDEAPEAPDANLRAMRVRHLLTMTTGHAEDTTERLKEDWVRAFLALPVEYTPGTHFVYNSGATYMLSAIAQRLSGTRLLDYLRPRLFVPLGIENPTWEMSPQGIDCGGWGLSLTTADIARFGQLYLQQGLWDGVRLVPADWVEEATAYQVGNRRDSAEIDWVQGYGYQFWRCRHDAYRGDGAFGQFCIVMPAQDAVLAITAGTANMQHMLDLVWKHLLPAMQPASLPEDSAGSAALRERLGTLRLAPESGHAMSLQGARVSGRTFVMAPNDDKIEAFTFHFLDDGCEITIQDDRGVQHISCGHGKWQRGSASFPHTDWWVRAVIVPSHLITEPQRPARTWQVAASGGWLDDRTYVVQVRWTETPYARTLTCHFDGDRLVVEQWMNVSLGPTERPRLDGRLA
jgi:CubicO group peptidase (beta-lactamase class C family)